MANLRKNTNAKRTLLIILGIILACLLTLNARSFMVADLHGNPVSKPLIEKISPQTTLDALGSGAIKKFYKLVVR